MVGSTDSVCACEVVCVCVRARVCVVVELGWAGEHGIEYSYNVYRYLRRVCECVYAAMRIRGVCLCVERAVWLCVYVRVHVLLRRCVPVRVVSMRVPFVCILPYACLRVDI